MELNETIVPGRNYSQSSSLNANPVASAAPANVDAQKDNTPVVGFYILSLVKVLVNIGLSSWVVTPLVALHLALFSC